MDHPSRLLLITKSVCRFSAGYPVKHSLTASDRTNSGSTRKVSRTQLGWTAAGATDILGQRAVVPALAGFKERMTFPRVGRRKFLIGVTTRLSIFR